MGGKAWSSGVLQLGCAGLGLQPDPCEPPREPHPWGLWGRCVPPSSGTWTPELFPAIALPEGSGINSRAMSFVLLSLPLCQSLPECQRHWHTPWRGRAPPSPQSLVVSCARTLLLWGARLGSAGATSSGSARVGCPEPGAVPGQSAPVCSRGRSAQVSTRQ